MEKYSLRLFGLLMLIGLGELLLGSGLHAQGHLTTPSEFLGYNLGDKFTLHHRVVDYTEHVASSVPGAKLIDYGLTSEGRPLQLLALSSEANLANLDAIRLQHLDRMIGGTGSELGDDIAIVWMSYNVHGNEAVCTESALDVMHRVAAEARKGADWLDRVVVLIDPCLNPDGHDRYAVWFNQYASLVPNADPLAFEHDEPWPGGRPNHYLFDLNRDWAWQKQSESQMRSAVYHQWMPHVHCDYHEMGYNSPYYFAPAAEPYHEAITDWQRAFQEEIGNATAAAFDARGELYFTRESFDLLYPSYGDTYPIYNGAIGMTYEQGGSGGAGVLIETRTGDLLSLEDRIQNHSVSSLEALYTSARLSERLVDEFAAFHERNRTQPAGTFKGYLIPMSDQNTARISQLVEFLARHQIDCQQVTQASKPLQAWEYGSCQKRTVTPQAGDLIISSYQTHSGLLDVLFDPNPVLSDSLTYDITTWSVPYAYGLRTYGLDKPLLGAPFQPTKISNSVGTGFGYAVRRNGDGDMKFLAQALNQGIRLRTNAKAISHPTVTLDRGTLLILSGDQKGNEHWMDEVVTLADECQVTLIPLPGGHAAQGPDLGSDDVWHLAAPRVGAFSGTGISSLGAGEVWWHFEQELHYPITMIHAAQSDPADFGKFDVLILPSGWYSFADEAWWNGLRDWVRDGGRLISIASSVNALSRQDGFDLETYDDESQRSEVNERTQAERKRDRLEAYADRDRIGAMRIGDGSIYPTTLDRTHPLAWGYPDAPYYTLRSGSGRFAALENGWTVGRYGTDPVSGFVGSRANRELEGSMVFGTQSMGNGNVTYLVDNPLFRGFWENGKLIFNNAVFLNVR